MSAASQARRRRQARLSTSGPATVRRAGLTRSSPAARERVRKRVMAISTAGGVLAVGGAGALTVALAPAASFAAGATGPARIHGSSASLTARNVAAKEAAARAAVAKRARLAAARAAAHAKTAAAIAAATRQVAAANAKAANANANATATATAKPAANSAPVATSGGS